MTGMAGKEREEKGNEKNIKDKEDNGREGKRNKGKKTTGSISVDLTKTLQGFNIFKQTFTKSRNH